MDLLNVYRNFLDKLFEKWLLGVGDELLLLPQNCDVTISMSQQRQVLKTSVKSVCKMFLNINNELQ